MSMCSIKVMPFEDISKNISDCQFSNKIKKEGFNEFHNIRLKIFSLNKLDFVDKSDTIYFLESSDIESSEMFGQIWTNNNNLTYSYYQNQLKFDINSHFTEYTRELVSKWEVKDIREEETLNASTLPIRVIYATRVIKNQNKLKIDCIAFREFFKPGRD